jgi:hypothetical protein
MSNRALPFALLLPLALALGGCGGTGDGPAGLSRDEEQRLDAAAAATDVNATAPDQETKP